MLFFDQDMLQQQNETWTETGPEEMGLLYWIWFCKFKRVKKTS